MGWTLKSYNALYDWPNIQHRARTRDIILADGLQEEVRRLEEAPTLGEWYRLTHEAAEAVGPLVVAASARAAEADLARLAQIHRPV